METIDQTVQRLTAFILENNPRADVAPGSVFSEQLLKTAASLQNLVTNDILALESAQSILTALATGSTVPDIMDQVASNFDVSRNAGTLATGKVKITVAEQSNYIIPAGFMLTQPALGLNYVTTADFYVAKTPTGADLPLYTSNGVSYFIIPVVAELPGSQYSNGVTTNTVFALGGTSTLSNFVSATAYGSFTAGQDVETNDQLITRLKLGVSTRTMTTPLSIEANVTETYPSVQSISVRGAGDAEMVRSKQYGINTFGMADVYVRSSTNLETATVEVVPEAVNFFTAATTQARYDLIAAGEVALGDIVTETSTNLSYVLSNLYETGEANWLPFTVSLAAYDRSKLSKLLVNDADIAGFYRVESVTDAESNGLEVLFTGFDYSLPTTGRSNTISTREQARFSKYQTSIVLINNPVSATPVTVQVEYQPYITNIQALFLNDTSRISCADYLVKAVVPCLVSCQLTVAYPANEQPLDTTKMVQDILSYINHLSFGESLSGSKLVGLCLAAGATSVKLPFMITGQLLLPDGTTSVISSNDALQIPDTAAFLAEGVTPHTTLFFADLNSLNLTVESY